MVAPRFRHRLGIAQVSHGHHRHRLVALGDAEQLARLPRIESGHLVNVKTKRRGLQRKVSRCLADIMKGVTVRLPIVSEIELGHRKDQHWRVTRPFAVPERWFGV